MVADVRAAGMPGALFQYARGLQAFESGPVGARRFVVHLGGLSDGMLSCSYVPALGAALALEGWGLVQPNLRSSYCQFGFRRLDDDVVDLRALLRHLAAERGCERVAICGHSTGCQIAAHLVRSLQCSEADADLGALLSEVVLQAAVSDRETDSSDVAEARARWLHVARETADADEMMPRDAFWAPITSARYRDLHEQGGADDYFSSDLADSALAESFGNFRPSGVGAMVALSELDEYCPASVDKPRLAQRLVRAIAQDSSDSPHQEPAAARYVALVVAGGDHSLSAPSATQSFVTAVVAFLAGREVESSLLDLRPATS